MAKAAKKAAVKKVKKAAVKKAAKPAEKTLVHEGHDVFNGLCQIWQDIKGLFTVHQHRKGKTSTHNTIEDAKSKFNEHINDTQFDGHS